VDNLQLQKSLIIDSFRGQYFWLSNFYGAPIEIDGILFPTTEHAYQAYKTLDLDIRTKMSRMPYANKVMEFGRQINVRRDWESFKLIAMENVLVEKFKIKVLKDRLVSTGEALLIEGNTWGDTYWGVCNGSGENNLGKILMKIRSSYAEV
jgi:ribA/ribD-fused uncharacterized protein